VVLRYWEDLSDAQIAATLGCSPGTVRSQQEIASTTALPRSGYTQFQP
jgi:DNA-directed RNA polymerase specialized sigma24 family protein